MTHQDPLSIFFKLPQDAPPVSILGLHPHRVSDEHILEARARRLTLVDQHPLSATPDADEARLAVHAAAAQLLQVPEPNRVQNIEPQGFSDPLPSPKPRLGVSSAVAALERDTLLLVGLAGGWSPRVLTRLAAIAITRGMKISDAVSAATRLAGRPAVPASRSPTQRESRKAHPAPPRHHHATPKPAPCPGESDEPLHDQEVLENWVRSALVVGGSAVATLLILVLGSVWAFRTLSGSTPTRSADPTVVLESASPNGRIAPPRDDVRNADLVLYELTAAQTLIQTNRSLQGVDRVASALEHWLAQWVTHAPTDWRNVQSRLIPLIQQIQTDPAADSALAKKLTPFLTSPGTPISARSVAPFVALSAILARLDPETPSEVTRVLTDAWHARTPLPVPTDSLSACKVSLVALAESQLENSAPAYEAWVNSTQAISRILAEDPSPILLQGATDLLARLEPPSQGEREAIELLAPVLDWRSGSSARVWLLTRLNDRTVHSERVSLLISALARTSSAPGIQTSLHLPLQSSWDERHAMSESLAKGWGLELHTEIDLFVQDWLDHADEVLALPEPRTTMDKLGRIGDLAYLNSSAILSLAGADDTAITNLSRVSKSQSRLDPRTPLFSPSSGSPLTLATASNDTEKMLDILHRIPKALTPLSHADAATLVDLTFRSRNENTKAAAADAIRPIALAPEIILAALEASPLIGDTTQSRALLSVIASDSVDPLPGEDWPDALHRTLARALLAHTTSPDAIVDHAVRRIRTAYSSAASVTHPDNTGTLPEHLRALTDHQLARIAPQLGARPISTPSRLVSLRETRLRVAKGSIQRYAIEHFALVTATAIGAPSNTPALQRPINSLWNRLVAEWSQSESALDQALSAEQALVRMHSITLSVSSSESSGSRAPLRITSPRSPESRSPRSTSPDVLIDASLTTESLASRLEQLTPDQPERYLDLGEELLVTDRAALAIHAFVLAATLADEQGDVQTAASACLALRTLTDDPTEQDLLQAIAHTLNPRLARPGWSQGPMSTTLHGTEGRDAARLLLDLRRGRGPHALELLNRDSIAGILMIQPELVRIAAIRRTTSRVMLAEHARAWPCPECKNTGTVRARRETTDTICPNCEGDPGVQLTDDEQSAWLSVEVRLLSPEAPWSSALVFQGHNTPVSSPEINAVPRMFRVDTSLTIYRNGQWAHP